MLLYLKQGFGQVSSSRFWTDEGTGDYRTGTHSVLGTAPPVGAFATPYFLQVSEVPSKEAGQVARALIWETGLWSLHCGHYPITRATSSEENTNKPTFQNRIKMDHKAELAQGLGQPGKAAPYSGRMCRWGEVQRGGNPKRVDKKVVLFCVVFLFCFVFSFFGRGGRGRARTN